ncbi:MAG: transcription antitermination factor NusB [Rhizomicrobium sp.]
MTAATAGHAGSDALARRGARLAAVQALYQMEQTNDDAEAVIDEFVEHRLGRETEISPGEPDAEFFADLLRGVPKHQVEIDRSVARSLSADWKLERIDSILRAILRAGTYELIGRKDVPAKVVIDEYVGISHAFFGGQEPSFVNAVLDKLAHRKRAPEFGETPPDDELQF